MRTSRGSAQPPWSRAPTLPHCCEGHWLSLPVARVLVEQPWVPAPPLGPGMEMESCLLSSGASPYRPEPGSGHGPQRRAVRGRGAAAQDGGAPRLLGAEGLQREGEQRLVGHEGGGSSTSSDTEVCGTHVWEQVEVV